MNVFQWLAEKPDGKTSRLERLAYLVFNNEGRLMVGSKTALKNLDEILELQYMAGVLNGLTLHNNGKDWPKVETMLERENIKLKAEEKHDVASQVASALSPSRN